MRRRILIVPALAAACLVTLSGCAIVDAGRALGSGFGGSGSSGFSAGSGSSSSGNTAVTALKVGDCVLDPDDEDDPDTSRVDVVPCTTSHDDEVTLVEDLGSGKYPGDVRVDKDGQIDCRDALEKYAATDFRTSQLDFYYFTPDSGTWATGDHSLVCFGYLWEGDELSRSIANSGL